MSEKKFRKYFSFLRKLHLKCCNKLPLLRRKDLSSAVYGLTNSLKIFHITQRDFFQLNVPYSDQ